jgi:SAM-dependent methyltransferase
MSASAVVVCPRCAGGLREDAAPSLSCAACGARFPNDGGVWDLAGAGPERSGYDPHYFPGIADADQRHFWFLARRECILDALRRFVPDLETRGLVDIGCGTGGLAAYLARSGVRMAGACDSYVEGLRVARTRVSAPLFLVDEGKFPPLAPGQDLIGLFDVLEHIDDDGGVLRSIAAVLGPGGTLVLTVPAHPFLFDEADRLAQHRRRYRRRELRAKLEAADFEVVHLTHFMAPLVPSLIATRLLGRVLAPVLGSAARRRDAELRVVPIVNPLFRAVLRLERAWLRRATLPFGTSLLAIARRPGCSTAA